MDDLWQLLVGNEAGALARFNQINRALVPALAGMAEMGRVRFAFASSVGAVMWAGVFTAIGYYSAEWWHDTSWVLHVVRAAVLLISIGGWLLLRRRRRMFGESARRATAGLSNGHTWRERNVVLA